MRESAESFAESAECCERLRVDAVWTVDGGRRWVQENGRRGRHRASRATVRHCGLVESGRIVAVPVESHGCGDGRCDRRTDGGVGSRGAAALAHV